MRLKKTKKLVAAHFNSPSYTVQDMKVILVEHIKKNNSWMRRTRESLDLHPGHPSPWWDEP